MRSILFFLLFQLNSFAGINGTKTKQEWLNERLLHDIRFRPLEDVKQLVFNGADVNAYSVRRHTTLHYAVELRSNSLAYVNFLLKNGADPNFRNHLGDISLHVAARFNEDPEVHTALIQHGAYVNAINRSDDNALHSAAWVNRNPEVFRVFLQNGVDANAINKSGKIPLDIAEDNNNIEVIEILEQYTCRTSFE